MAEAGCLYHTSWIIDDQPWPINVRGGQKFIFVPYTGQTNDAGMLAWNREADYFQQMIKDQFDTLYREGAENGRVMCLSLHPHNIGRPNAAKHLDEALRYILGHDGVWATTADDIAEYYLANYYDQVKSWIAERKTRDTGEARKDSAMDLKLTGKVALVTGSSRGIGLATAKAFAAEGCRVMLSARSTEQLRGAETALRATGAEVAAHAADVGDPDDAAGLIEATVAAFGGIDILVNNVGGGGGGARIADSTMTTGAARWSGT